MSEPIGWLATALFGASYFVKEPGRMRLVQAGAASVWIAYGVLIGAWPVIVANAVVASLAVLSTFRGRSPARSS
jgi:hypothetical protein